MLEEPDYEDLPPDAAIYATMEAVREAPDKQAGDENIHIYAITDLQTGEEISLIEALRRGLLDPKTGAYKNPLTGEVYSMQEAIARKLIKAQAHMQSRPVTPAVTPILQRRGVPAAQGSPAPARRVAKSPSPPRRGVKPPDKEAQIQAVVDPRTGREITLDEAISQGIVDFMSGMYVDSNSGRRIPLDKALEHGLVRKEGTPPRELGPGGLASLDVSSSRSSTLQSGLQGPLASSSRVSTLEQDATPEMMAAHAGPTGMPRMPAAAGTSSYEYKFEERKFEASHQVSRVPASPQNQVSRVRASSPDSETAYSASTPDTGWGSHHRTPAVQSGKIEPPFGGGPTDPHSVQQSFLGVGPANTDPGGTLTFSDALQRGLINVTHQEYTDPHTGDTMPIPLAIRKGLLMQDVPSVDPSEMDHSLDGSVMSEDDPRRLPRDFTPDRQLPREFTPDRQLEREFTPDRQLPREFTPDRQAPREYTPDRQFPGYEPSREFTPERQLPREFTPERQLLREFTPERQLPREFTPERQLPREFTPERERISPERTRSPPRAFSREQSPELTIAEALAKGLISVKSQTYTDPITGDEIPIQEAMDAGLLGTSEMSRPANSIKEAIAQGLVDPITGAYLDPQTGRIMTTDEAILLGLINLRCRSVSPAEGEDRPPGYSFNEALKKGYIDPSANTFYDPSTGRTIKLDDAIIRGLVRPQLPSAGGDGVSSPVDPRHRPVHGPVADGSGDRAPGRRRGDLDRRSAERDRKSAERDRPGDIDQQLGDLEMRLGDLDRRPTDFDRRSAERDLDRRSADRDRRSAERDRQPGVMDRQPGVMDRQPGVMDRRAGDVDQQLEDIEKRLGDLDRRPQELETMSLDRRHGKDKDSRPAPPDYHSIDRKQAPKGVVQIERDTVTHVSISAPQNGYPTAAQQNGTAQSSDSMLSDESRDSAADEGFMSPVLNGKAGSASSSAPSSIGDSDLTPAPAYVTKPGFKLTPDGTVVNVHTGEIMSIGSAMDRGLLMDKSRRPVDADMTSDVSSIGVSSTVSSIYDRVSIQHA